MKRKLFPIFVFIGLFIISATVIIADYLTIPPQAFQGDMVSKLDWWWTYLYNYGDSQAGGAAPVYLPDKAEILGITLSYYDSGEMNIRAILFRQNVFDGTYTRLFTVDSSDSVDSIRSASDYVIKEGYDGKVDTSTQAYWVCCIIQPDYYSYRIYGVQIEYKLKKDK